jgi:hypothetical protein
MDSNTEIGSIKPQKPGGVSVNPYSSDRSVDDLGPKSGIHPLPHNDSSLNVFSSAFHPKSAIRWE